MLCEGAIMTPPTNRAGVLGRALQKGAWDGVTGNVRRFTD